MNDPKPGIRQGTHYHLVSLCALCMHQKYSTVNKPGYCYSIPTTIDRLEYLCWGGYVVPRWYLCLPSNGRYTWCNPIFTRVCYWIGLAVLNNSSQRCGPLIHHTYLLTCIGRKPYIVPLVRHQRASIHWMDCWFPISPPEYYLFQSLFT